MAKVPKSVIGIDLGQHAMKAVLLQRRNGKVAVTHFASRELGEPVSSTDELTQELRLLLKELGGSARACAVAVSSRSAILRIIEQPDTPPETLRNVLRLNGVALLNQDCRDFVIDCAPIQPGSAGDTPVPAPSNEQVKYLVGGVSRVQISQIDEAFQKIRSGIHLIQIAPICAFNAFESAHEEVFQRDAFMLVDIGHTTSTVIVGVKGELILVRSIEYGGKDLLDALVSHGAADHQDAIQRLVRQDPGTLESARFALTMLAREVSSSIGFFEARREETMSKLFVSGGPAQIPGLLKVLQEEVHMPCEAWNAFQHVEVGVHASRRQEFEQRVPTLHVACGAAAEVLMRN